MTGFRRGHTRAAKLTPSQVLEIREKWNEGQTQASLAREYQMSEVQIGRICRGTSWQDYRRPPHPGEVEHSKAVLTMGTADPVELDPALARALAEELAAAKAVAKTPGLPSSSEVLAKAAFYTSGAKPGPQTTEETHNVEDNIERTGPQGPVPPKVSQPSTSEDAKGETGSPPIQPQ